MNVKGGRDRERRRGGREEGGAREILFFCTCGTFLFFFFVPWTAAAGGRPWRARVLRERRVARLGGRARSPLFFISRSSAPPFFSVNSPRTPWPPPRPPSAVRRWRRARLPAGPPRPGRPAWRWWLRCVKQRELRARARPFFSVGAGRKAYLAGALAVFWPCSRCTMVIDMRASRNGWRQESDTPVRARWEEEDRSRGAPAALLRRRSQFPRAPLFFSLFPQPRRPSPPARPLPAGRPKPRPRCVGFGDVVCVRERERGVRATRRHAQRRARGPSSPTRRPKTRPAPCDGAHAHPILFFFFAADLPYPPPLLSSRSSPRSRC